MDWGLDRGTAVDVLRHDGDALWSLIDSTQLHILKL
jgi:hypothetical protein